MATVDVSPSGFDAGAPVLDSPAVVLIINVVPQGFDAGAPDLAHVDLLILYQLWPFRPEIPTQETLEWLTDMLPSYTGEQRIALRPAPRQTFAYSFKLKPPALAKAKAFAQRRIGTPLSIPVWIEQQDVGPIDSADTTIACDTTWGDWRIGVGVMIWSDYETFTTAIITDVADDLLTLLGPVGMSFSRAVIAPIRSALAIEGIQARRDTTYADASGKFQSLDNVFLEGDAGYPTYLGLDVLDESPKLIADINETIVRASEYVDNGFGPVIAEHLTTYPDFGQSLGFHEFRGARLWRRRVWLHSLMGKQKAFWLPSFNMDLALQATIGATDTVITVKSVGPASFYGGRQIAIFLKNGTKFFRQINSAATAGANDNLTISSALGQSVAVADIGVLCFMSKVRLNADAVTLDHQFEDASTVSVPVTEVPA
ncbi:hypothetical protein EN802_13570 [bacterium M00.F.Ca.ET.159.01.1.1]|nr:hypothetical protein EN802_13570 [bacterium M00.F.Ca.ET.159.01.1.1]